MLMRKDNQLMAPPPLYLISGEWIDWLLLFLILEFSFLIQFYFLSHWRRWTRLVEIDPLESLCNNNCEFTQTKIRIFFVATSETLKTCNTCTKILQILLVNIRSYLSAFLRRHFRTDISANNVLQTVLVLFATPIRVISHALEPNKAFLITKIVHHGYNDQRRWWTQTHRASPNRTNHNQASSCYTTTSEGEEVSLHT